MSDKAKDGGEIEDCPELDDDYFALVGQSFNEFEVVDTWNEDDTDEVKIKKEVNKESPARSSSSKKRSRSKESSNLSRNVYDNRRRNRSRSPIRIAPRRSPIRRPPNPGLERRQESFVRKKEQVRESFLTELQQKFAAQGKEAPEIENLLRQGDNNKRQRTNSNQNQRQQQQQQNNQRRQQQQQQQQQNQQQQMYYNNNMQMNYQNDQMMQQQQQFSQMMMQPMNMNMNMNMPMNQFPQQMPNPYAPVQYDMYGNPMMMMQPVQPLIIPQPVPAPIISNPVQEVSPPIEITKKKDKNPIASTSAPKNKEMNLQNATKKGALNLTDVLRLMSKQSSKPDLSTKKKEVYKRCKDASKMITELESKKFRPTLTCVMSKETLPSLALSNNKSPLLFSEKNPQFLLQATKLQCRNAFQNNPLRNIYGPMSSLARNLKFDLVELSQKVEKVDKINREKEESVQASISNKSNEKRVAAVGITSKRNLNKLSQTDEFVCYNCKTQEFIKKNLKSKAIQTTSVSTINSETQCDEEEEGSFSCSIDAQTMRDRTFEQHHALQVFLQAFKIKSKYSNPDDFEDERKVNRNIIQQQRFERTNDEDDRMNFTNPENPNVQNFNHRQQQQQQQQQSFFSLSPIRPPGVNSPKRKPIFDRIGDKLPDTPTNFNDYSPRRDSDDVIKPYTIPLSPLPFVIKPRSISPGPSRERGRYRNVSPIDPRMIKRDDSRGRRSRSNSIEQMRRGRDSIDRMRGVRGDSIERKRGRSDSIERRSRDNSRDRMRNRDPIVIRCENDYYNNRLPSPPGSRRHTGFNDRRGRY